MTYKTVYELFDDIGYTETVTIPFERYRHKSRFKKADRQNPDDFNTFVRSDMAELKFNSCKQIYNAVVYKDNTLEITVLEVDVDGKKYLIRFTGDYNSWSDTEYYRDPVFCIPVEVITTEYQEIKEGIE